MIVKTRLPITNKTDPATKESINAYQKEKKIEVEIKIKHDGDVNKARAMPFANKYNIIATQNSNGEILIFDYFKHPNQPKEENEESKPSLRLKGHSTVEGYGLNWNTLKEGELVSGNGDGKVCLWQINEQKNMSPIIEWKEHDSCNDVCFNKKNGNILLSCGEDKKLILYDTRQNKPINIINLDSEINTVDFNNVNENIFLAGCNDNNIGLYDLRNLNLRMHSFIHHNDKVIGVKWNNKLPNIFASFSDDKKVLVWDVTKIGTIMASVDNEDGPSELLFTHGGHTAPVYDIDWNKNEDLMLASVSSDNSLHIWEMDNLIYHNDNEL